MRASSSGLACLPRQAEWLHSSRYRYPLAGLRCWAWCHSVSASAVFTRYGNRRDKTEAEDALMLDRKSARRGVHSQWISVALVTIANGGDNLGVYIPLFSRDLPWFPIYAGVFAVMTGIWCAAGYWLVNHPVLGARIRQYGHRVFPWVLIALGLLILSDALVLVR